MKIKHLLLLLCFKGLAYAAIAQCAIPPASGDPCIKLTQERMRVFENQLRELLRLGEADKKMYGTSGAYAAAANNFHDHVKNAVDTARRMVDWLATNGDGNPAVTTYSEASWVQGWIWSIMDNLKHANWWASVSAIRNKGVNASCGIEKSLQLLAEGLNILTYSSRCYVGAYKEVPPCGK
jgi:hypothetical protein